MSAKSLKHITCQLQAIKHAHHDTIKKCRYVRPIIAALPTEKKEEPHPRSSADDIVFLHSVRKPTIWVVGRNRLQAVRDLVNRVELVPRTLKICVVQWRRKRKETESWKFFGGFEAAGVGLCEWGSLWLVQMGHVARGAETRSALWRLLPARRVRPLPIKQAASSRAAMSLSTSVDRTYPRFLP
jgi:hypothetical protein